MIRPLSILGALALTPLFTNVAEAADGAQIYQKTCQACHQDQGQGLPPTFPPVAKSEWVTGPAENLIRIQLRGLTGEIEVAGQKYNSAMPPNADMTDEEIAAVLTYIRSNFGNNASAVTADMVKAHRGEVGKPMLTVADLKDPNTVEETPDTTPDTTDGGAETTTEGNAEEPAAKNKAEKATDYKLDTGSNALIIGLVIAWIAICTIPALFGGKK